MARVTNGERISRFVVRGRRLLATRLACNEDLPAGPEPERPTVDHFTLDYHDEESIDAALARLRPLTLQNNEDVYYVDVFTAIREEISEPNETILNAISRHEGEWATLRKPTMRESMGGVTDRFIAYRYLYGDLVHADPPAEQSFRMRLHAAQSLALDAIKATNRTLLMIRRLDIAGRLSVEPSAWTEQVSMEGARRAHFPLLSLHIGEPGTALPESADEPLDGPGWTMVIGAGTEGP